MQAIRLLCDMRTQAVDARTDRSPCVSPEARQPSPSGRDSHFCNTSLGFRSFLFASRHIRFKHQSLERRTFCGTAKSRDEKYNKDTRNLEQ